MSRSVIVMPDDTSKPILDAINGATKSLRVKMFIFSDPSLLKAVIEAKRRGVDVRVMLNPARRDGESENKESHKQLVAGGVTVKDSNPDYDVTHEKSMVVDDVTAFVKSSIGKRKTLPKPATTRSSHRILMKSGKSSIASKRIGRASRSRVTNIHT